MHTDEIVLQRRAKMWASGMRIRDIANVECITYRSMRKYMTLHRDRFPHRRYRTITPDDVAKMRALRSEGKGYRAIADVIGCSHQAVSNHLRGKVKYDV